ncbi:MAG: ATP-binding protein [Chloroflexota bacterium]|nr:ATP-binding protein [Chloroflexota bacterium]
MFRSIQWRIAVPFILLIVFSMGILGFHLFDYVRDVQIDNLRAQLRGEASLIRESSLPLFANVAETGKLDDLAMKSSQQIDARVTIIARDGTVRGDSEENPATMENHADRPEVQGALSAGFGESTRYSSTLDQMMMYVAVPLESAGDVIGVARVALPLAEVDRSMDRLAATVALSVGMATLFAILMSLLIARAITRPIKDLTRAANRMTAGNLDQNIYVGTRDESAELASAFNEMAQSLKQMIDALSAERNRLAAVLLNMVDGVIMIDRNGIIMMVNKAAARLFGFAEEIAVGSRLIEIIPDYEINDVFRSCLSSGEQRDAHVERAVVGSFMRVIATPISGDGASGALLLFQDLAQARRLQTVRQKFVGNISHELRTPLASIKAIVETLSDGAINDPKASSDFLGMIDREIDRMTQMVRELAELSRIETREKDLNLAPVDLNLTIEAAIAKLKPQAERKQIEVTQKVDPQLPMALAEEERIQQVLTNLLHNAIKFTPDGGKVTLSVEVENDGVVVSVCDSGVGIPADDLPHVFERFYKADKARSSEGTGLGLAIAKHIIHAHGGEIWVESVAGKTTTFSFSLPGVHSPNL